jgi:hypothetical protein
VVLRRYVLEVVPSLITLDHRVWELGSMVESAAVFLQEALGVWLRLGSSHIRCLLPECRGRTYYSNASVGQEMKIFSQFNAFCGHKYDADTFGKCLWNHHVVTNRKEQMTILGT